MEKWEMESSRRSSTVLNFPNLLHPARLDHKPQNVAPVNRTPPPPVSTCQVRTLKPGFLTKGQGYAVSSQPIGPALLTIYSK